jgi:uncharacterized protein YjbJ (UPF0337 family)
MKWSVAEANWDEFRSEVRAHWARLSNQQLDTAAGRRPQLARMIREAYGSTAEEAEHQIRNFEALNKNPRPVSSR